MSLAPMRARASRVAEVIAAVVRQALRDSGMERIALVHDGSPEAAWCAAMLNRELGQERVVTFGTGGPGVEPLLRLLPVDAARDRAPLELARLRVRCVADALPTAPFNKTALLLGGPLPPEPLLPLGDLYASEAAELCGGWSLPAEARALADAAGGIQVLDAALRQRIDRRDPAGLDSLGAVAPRVRDALDRGRMSRIHSRIVPKIAHRTLGTDLFE